ncbi:hypothetical protein GA0115252_13839 [Streptomyces sp. DfronAA-171]|nr:hypothetical protein GA0115252_13839 [Streptomyces sp. DfronAA-171]
MPRGRRGGRARTLRGPREGQRLRRLPARVRTAARGRRVDHPRRDVPAAAQRLRPAADLALRALQEPRRRRRVHPARGVLDQQPFEHRGERARLTGRRVGRLEDRVRRLDRRRPVEGVLPLDGLVERRPERPQVGGRPRHGDAGAQPLGRQVLHGADEFPGPGQRGRARLDGDPEVGEHDAPTLAEEHVRRLHVAVQHTHRVRGAQRGEHRPADARGLRDGQRAVLAEHVGERPGRHVLHDDARQAAVVHDVVDHDDVRVRDHRGAARLAPRARVHALELVLGEVRRHMELLQRDTAPEHRVLGEVDGAHAPAADPFEQPVAATDEPVRFGHVPAPLDHPLNHPWTHGNNKITCTNFRAARAQRRPPESAAPHHPSPGVLSYSTRESERTRKQRHFTPFG